jgi:diadenosine tetraphosphatase ApaH/serine/threonine PP2A family protein phosphatase
MTPAPVMTRYIFIGDIHGCYDELVKLLARAAVTASDRVIALGDMTRKGPAADRCLALWRERGYLAVRGNNDATLLHRSERAGSRWLAPSADRRVLRDRALLDYMRSWPLYLDLPEIGVVAVHGGVLPNAAQFSASLAPAEAALELRRIRRDTTGQWTPVSKRDATANDPFWADVWNGDRRIVYGHTPRREAREHPRALGLDTGCVYGGKLTAAIFESADTWRLVAIPARERYSS